MRGMDTDIPASPAAPMPLKEKSKSEDFKARDPQTTTVVTCQKESTDPKPTPQL